jgi:hypothetical protein
MLADVRPGEVQGKGTAHTVTLDHNRTLATLQRAIFLISLPFGMQHVVSPILGQDVGAGAGQIGPFFFSFSLIIVLFREPGKRTPGTPATGSQE